MSVAASVQSHFASKHAIDDDKVNDGEDHSECPPNQTDSHRVRSRERVLYRDVMAQVAA